MRLIAAVIAALTAIVSTSGADACRPLLPTEEEIVRLAVESTFRDSDAWGAMVLIRPTTEPWLSSLLEQAVGEVDPDVIFGVRDYKGLRDSNSQQCDLPAELIVSAAGVFPKEAFVSLDAGELANPECLALRIGFPVTEGYVSRPFLDPSNQRALIAVGQSHSWNHCGLWAVLRFRRVNDEWVELPGGLAILW